MLFVNSFYWGFPFIKSNIYQLLFIKETLPSSTDINTSWFNSLTERNQSFVPNNNNPEAFGQKKVLDIILSNKYGGCKSHTIICLKTFAHDKYCTPVIMVYVYKI